MKTSIIGVSMATGAALDYLVAKAVYLPVEVTTSSPPVVRLTNHRDMFEAGARCWAFSPSTSWSQAGPIITRNRISIHFCTDLRDRNGKYVHAEMDTHRHHGYSKGHDEPLIAAMRCHVTPKLGTAVLVPSELVNP